MRSKVLFLCHNVPYPPDEGALIRSYHTLQALSREFDVTALCFSRRSRDTPVDRVSSAVHKLSDLCEIEAFPIPQQRNPLRLVVDHVRSLVTRRAYTRWVYESATFRRRLAAVVRGSGWAVAYVDSIDLVAYLDALAGLPVVLAHHNVESQLLFRRAEMVAGVKGWYIALQAALTQREEKWWCRHVPLNIVVSRQDEATLEQLAGGGHYSVVPNGVDTSVFAPTRGGRENGVVFVGGASWFPNRDAMWYFAKEILPLMRDERPGISVTWVGRAPHRLQHEMSRLGVKMTGYVQDIRPHVHRSACFIVPLRVGGGTRIKILDAWALGKAVVSTSQGCEGLAAADGENILIRDSPEDFARAVLQLLDDQVMRRRIGGAARATAVATYDWQVVGRHMTNAMRRLLELPRP